MVPPTIVPGDASEVDAVPAVAQIGVPAASTPTKLPWIVLPLAAVVRLIPFRKLPEMRLPSPAPAPPMTLVVALV